jgi:hypothetical protein
VIAEPSGGRDNDCRGDTDNDDDDGAKAEQQQPLPLCLADRLATASTAQTSLVTVVRPDIFLGYSLRRLGAESHTMWERGAGESKRNVFCVQYISHTVWPMNHSRGTRYEWSKKGDG